jgi:MOSC domain-containing protein YiiM
VRDPVEHAGDDGTVRVDTVRVVSVHLSPSHTMSKPVVDRVRLVEGIGIEGDAHAGTTVKHRSRVARDPTQPNLRQVHLIPSELHAELSATGFAVEPGAMGENVTTCGIDLLEVPTGTRLRLGSDAVVEITGLRNPCRQLEGVRPGLQAAVLDHDAGGDLIRRAGVMAVVVAGGDVRAGDRIDVELPPPPHHRLGPV